MNRNLLQTVVRHAEALAVAPSAAPDAQLLERFARHSDNTAFAELVRRHGPMVWAVCRHTLTDPTDADDAFQATFLALVRSAKRIRSGAAVGGWLHGVAVRVCAKLRRGEARRRQREHKVACPEADQPVPESTWDELLAAVHEEVQNLPDGERTAFVLCDLEGVRQPDAAERLGWKLGTLSGRLTKARQHLLQRLTRRGLTPALAAGGLAVGGTSQAMVPEGLVHQVVELSSAGGAVPAAIHKLAIGVVPMSRTKLFAAAVFAAGGLGLGFGSSWLATADAQSPAVTAEIKSLLGGGGSGDGDEKQPPGGGRPPRGDAGGPPAGQGSSGGRGGSDGPSQGGPSGQPGAPGGRGAGGAPGGMPGPAMGGGMAMTAPARPQWDYQFVDRPGNPEEFKRVLRTHGNDGWEYGGTGPGDLLVFKRVRTPAVIGGMGPGLGMGGMNPGPQGPMGGGPGNSGPGMLNPRELFGRGFGSVAPGGGGGSGGEGGRAGGRGDAPGGARNFPGSGAKKDLTTITLKQAQADRVVKLVEDMLQGRDYKLNVVPGTNALMLYADTETTELATKVIEAIDKVTTASPPPPRPAK
jgi:RNA polymerase sigma factor (sigma-70 family)